MSMPEHVSIMPELIYLAVLLVGCALMGGWIYLGARRRLRRGPR